MRLLSKSRYFARVYTPMICVMKPTVTLMYVWYTAKSVFEEKAARFFMTLYLALNGQYEVLIYPRMINFFPFIFLFLRARNSLIRQARTR